MTVHVNELTMGRVVSVFYNDGVTVTGMVSEIEDEFAVVDVVESNNINYVNASVTIRGFSCHNPVHGKNGWCLPS